ncbi:MAG: hypothetical protein IJV67_02465 [Clostridia bacterium]|nr:hypothetical protein [Clostridia bacterium]
MGKENEMGRYRKFCSICGTPAPKKAMRLSDDYEIDVYDSFASYCECGGAYTSVIFWDRETSEEECINEHIKRYAVR